MKCPLADYLKKWNIECPLPLKQDKETCRHCEYWREGKCRYNQITAEKEKRIMRGFGALTKQTAMKLRERGRINEETAKEFERAGVKSSTLKDKEEQRQYWEISRAYDEEWEKASPEKRAELEWRVHHWQKFMEDGFSPKEADERARELDYEFWSGMKYEDETS